MRIDEAKIDYDCYYVSPDGNDNWTGRKPIRDENSADGPFATIGRAQQTLRDIKQSACMSGPVTVYLRGGNHHITEPVIFTPQDSGPFTYTSYPGEKAVIHGGKKIDGWSIEEIGGKSVWSAEIPEVKEGRWYFKQLFVNNERRSRPRLPKKGFYRAEDVPGLSFAGDAFGDLFNGSYGFKCYDGEIEEWKNMNDVDIVVLHYWIEERLPVLSFDRKENIVKSSRKSMFALRDDVSDKFARYYAENIFEALTEPGEWYLDRSTGKIYYIPMSGEEISTAEIYAPIARQLIKLEGNPEKNEYVEYIRFINVSFSCSEWDQPSGGHDWMKDNGNYITDENYAAAAQAAVNVLGVIRMEGARFCSFENCEIAHIGWYGIEMSDGCTANRLKGNHIWDAGAGGIKLNGAKADGVYAGRTGSNKISDNHIHHLGNVFHSAVGILSMHSYGNEISHNHIHHLYYTGISCGWVWGYGRNISSSNTIEKNLIHDIGFGYLSDMGGIYVLGVQPGTVVRNNLIYNIEKSNYGGWGIYLDEGASHIVVERNICYNMSSQCFHQHYGRENTIRNNIFAFGKEGVVSLTRPEAHVSFTFEKNIVIADRQPIMAFKFDNYMEPARYYCDLNVYWDVSNAEINFGKIEYDTEKGWHLVSSASIREMQAKGFEMHSLVCNPDFVDLYRFDFILSPGSKVFDTGFEQIDISDVGVRE